MSCLGDEKKMGNEINQVIVFAWINTKLDKLYFIKEKWVRKELGTGGSCM
jgi:hypothetical protein